MNPGKLDKIYDFSNPRRVGPGAWNVFLVTAANSSSTEEGLWACKMIRQFCKFFKCKDCHGHSTEYIAKHPPENTVTRKGGLFDWVVEFMNSVQMRLGKPIYDHDILYRMFTETDFNVCTDNCSGEVNDNIALMEDINRIMPGMVSIGPSSTHIGSNSKHTIIRPASRSGVRSKSAVVNTGVIFSHVNK